MRIFRFSNDDSDEDIEEEKLTGEALKAMMQLSRISRRKLLKQGSHPEENDHPLHRIHERISYAMAENQEQCEQSFGEDFLAEYSFSEGAYHWFTEPSEEQRLFIIVGVMMSIWDATTMIDLVNSLGLDKEVFMEFAKDQVEHIKSHQQTVGEAIDKATQKMDEGSILDDAESHLKSTE